MIWEEQGIVGLNPNMEIVLDSGYGGSAWYLAGIDLENLLEGLVFLHVNGIRDIWTFD